MVSLSSQSWWLRVLFYLICLTEMDTWSSSIRKYATATNLRAPNTDVFPERDKERDVQDDIIKDGILLNKMQASQISFQNQLNEKSSQLATLLANIHSYQYHLYEYMARHIKLDGDYNNLQMGLHNTRHLLLEAHAHKNNLRHQILQMTTRLGSLRTISLKLKKQMTAHHQKIKGIAFEDQILAEILNKIQKKIVLLETEVDALGKKSKHKSHQLIHLEAAIGVMGEELNLQSDQWVELKGRQKILETLIGDKVKDLEGLKTKLGVMETILGDQSGRLEKIKFESGILRRQLRAQNGHLHLLLIGVQKVNQSWTADPSIDLQKKETKLTNVKNRIGFFRAEKRRLIQTAQNVVSCPVPKGFVYVQLPFTSSPGSLWRNTSWIDISHGYANLFFRVEGGDSAPFGMVQNENAPRLISLRYGSEKNLKKLLPAIPTSSQRKTSQCNDWSRRIKVGFFEEEKSFRKIQFKTGDCAVRPRNTAIRIWQRNL